MLHDDVWPLSDEKSPQFLDDWLRKEGASLFNVVLLENLVAAILNVVESACEFLAEPGFTNCLLGYGGEKDYEDHKHVSLGHGLLTQVDPYHELPYFLLHLADHLHVPVWTSHGNAELCSRER